MILIGDREAKTVMPVFWKSKIIRKVCKSPKDAETINMGILADIARHTANQMEQVLSSRKDKKKVQVKLFTDSLGTLESIASTHQVERRMMRADILDLKQKLEVGEVDMYCWVQDEKMVADILTKEEKEKYGLDDLLKEKKLDIVINEDNCVKYVDGRDEISGRKLRKK